MKIAIIADDLTGANATGVRLSRQGFSTTTLLEGLTMPSSSYDVICVDTDSRYIAPQKAAKRVQEAGSYLKNQGAQLFCKRIDSTVRGNIGIEIDALLEVEGKNSMAIVVPAFPESGRMIVGGYLMVHGVPVQQTDAGQDPVSPLTKSYVPDLIREQSEHQVTHIGMEKVLEGALPLHQQLKHLSKQGARVVVIDATTVEQIETIAEAMIGLDQPLVCADPGPLSSAFALKKYESLLQGPKILVTVGSVTSLTGRQLHHLQQKWDIDPVYVQPEPLALGPPTWSEEVERATKEAVEKLAQQQILLVTSYQPGGETLHLSDLSQQEGLTEGEIANRISDGLAAISRKVIQQSDGAIKGCFTSGGDVTASLCAVSRAKGIELLDEVMPLAAYGQLIEGYLDGTAIVTKGGMVGDETAISESVRFLLTKLSRS